MLFFLSLAQSCPPFCERSPRALAAIRRDGTLREGLAAGMVGKSVRMWGVGGKGGTVNLIPQETVRRISKTVKKTREHSEEKIKIKALRATVAVTGHGLAPQRTSGASRPIPGQRLSPRPNMTVVSAGPLREFRQEPSKSFSESPEDIFSLYRLPEGAHLTTRYEVKRATAGMV